MTFRRLNPGYVLLLTSAFLALFFTLTINFTYPGGAAAFIYYVDALLNNTLTSEVVQRDIGFPLFLILSGYSWHHSLWGIVFLQALMGFLLPLLVYNSIKEISSRAAYLTSLLMIFSLTPFYFIKWIHHDQVYLFFMTLSVFFLLRFIKNANTDSLFSRRPLQNASSSYSLYAMALSVLITSLTRPAGHYLFFIFLALAYFYRRGSVLQYLICLFLGCAVFWSYGHHREHILNAHHNQETPSYVGQQVFYDLYINSKEYGIKLGAFLGPHFKTLTEKAYEKSLPHPKDSPLVQTFEEVPLSFLTHYFHSFSSNQLLEQIYLNPNYEYYSYLCAVAPDSTLLAASFEIIKTYPLYPLKYIFRNMRYFLVDPGYNHPRFSAEPLTKLGQYTAYAMKGDNSKQYYTLSKRAIAELEYNYAGRSIIAQSINHIIKVIVVNAYHPLVLLIFFLMTIAWSTTFIGPFIPQLQALAKSVSPAIWSVTVILMANILIASAFVEADYRYHHFIMPLKIIIAGYGLAIISHLKMTKK